MQQISVKKLAANLFAEPLKNEVFQTSKAKERVIKLWV
jgi:hypothetical protein